LKQQRGASLVRQVLQGVLEVHRVNTGAAMLLILTLVSPSLCFAKNKIFETIENGLTGILRAQLNKLDDGFGLVKEQLDVEKRLENITQESMQALNSKISGSYDMGKLVNDTKEQAKRRWSPSDILNSHDNGNAEYNKLLKQHEQKYNFEKEHSFGMRQPGSKQALKEIDKTQKAAVVSAQYTSQKINDNIANIESLMGKIDRTENQKAATDLNSRIQSQVALELVELKRLSALQLQTMGTMSQQSLLEQQGSAQFNRWA
jgi:hypothetical protein